MDKAEYVEAINRIRTGKIHSSSEVVFFALDKMLQVLAEEKKLSKFAEFTLQLVKSRPTSALLINVARELSREIIDHKEESIDGIIEHATRKVDELKKRIQTSVELSAGIAEKRIESGDTILTASYSLFVKKTIENALRKGKEIKIIVTESRPGSEGLRMASELVSLGCDVTLIVDSAVRFVMKNVDKVLLSSESVTANGANVNKIGSSQIALAAHEARVRVFVVTTTLKFSPETIVGEMIEIPEADTSEIRELLEKKGLDKVKVKAPLFDVTPPEYIDAIITEKGLVAPSFAIMTVRDLYGWPPRPLLLDESLRELLGVDK
ncbi:MAG: initiation factor 2B [Infirmifilum sp.]